MRHGFAVSERGFWRDVAAPGRPYRNKSRCKLAGAATTIGSMCRKEYSRSFGICTDRYTTINRACATWASPGRLQGGCAAPGVVFLGGFGCYAAITSEKSGGWGLPHGSFTSPDNDKWGHKRGAVEEKANFSSTTPPVDAARCGSRPYFNPARMRSSSSSMIFSSSFLKRGSGWRRVWPTGRRGGSHRPVQQP